MHRDVMRVDSPLSVSSMTSSLDGGNSLVRSCSRKDVRAKRRANQSTPQAMDTASMTYEEQMESEIQDVRRQLSEAFNSLEETHAQIELQRTQTRKLAMHWRARIHEADEQLRREKIERDQELKEITSQLLFLENQIRKERREMQQALDLKDATIKENTDNIRHLEERNRDIRGSIENLTLLYPEPYWQDILIPSEEDTTQESISEVDYKSETSTTPQVNIQRHESTSSQAKSVTFNLTSNSRAIGFRRTLSLPNCHSPRRKSILKSAGKIMSRNMHPAMEVAESLPNLTDDALDGPRPRYDDVTRAASSINLTKGRDRRRVKQAPRGAVSLTVLSPSAFHEGDYNNGLMFDNVRDPGVQTPSQLGKSPRRKAAHNFYISPSTTSSVPSSKSATPSRSSNRPKPSSTPSKSPSPFRSASLARLDATNDSFFEKKTKLRESTRDKFKRIFAIGRDNKRKSSLSTASSSSTDSLASSNRSSTYKASPSPGRRVFTALLK